MKITEAKNLIRCEMEKILLITISKEWAISSHRALGVKIGRITSKEAAGEEISEYTRACTEAFNFLHK